MAHSSKPAVCRKPHPDYPLTPRKDGRWCKKIRGKVYIFSGSTDEALAEYDRVKNDLLRGKTPRPKVDGVTVADVCNRYMTTQDQLADGGEIKKRTRDERFATCKLIVDELGKNTPVVTLTTEDFERLRWTLTKRWGSVRVGNEVQRIRSVFKYAFDAGLIATPVRFGAVFRRPSAKTLRKLKHSKPPRMFEAREIRRLLKAAGPQLKAMILLGINVAYGNNDCALLPRSALDLAGGWASFARPKTGQPRRAKLWPETVEAIRQARAVRYTPHDEANSGLVFITKRGLSWSKDTPDNPISKETTKLLDSIALRRPGLNFYSLRHSFATVATESLDQLAVDHIMGHIDPSVPARYREKPPSDARLEAVAEHVRRWLFRDKHAKAQTRDRKAGAHG